MLAEKGTDSLGTKIGHTVVSIPRQNDGVGEDNLVSINAALEIA